MSHQVYQPSYPGVSVYTDPVSGRPYTINPTTRQPEWVNAALPRQEINYSPRAYIVPTATATSAAGSPTQLSVSPYSARYPDPAFTGTARRGSTSAGNDTVVEQAHIASIYNARGSQGTTLTKHRPEQSGYEEEALDDKIGQLHIDKGRPKAGRRGSRSSTSGSAPGESSSISFQIMDSKCIAGRGSTQRSVAAAEVDYIFTPTDRKDKYEVRATESNSTSTLLPPRTAENPLDVIHAHVKATSAGSVHRLSLKCLMVPGWNTRQSHATHELRGIVRDGFHAVHNIGPMAVDGESIRQLVEKAAERRDEGLDRQREYARRPSVTTWLDTVPLP
ncbi:uncharacterized protein I303_107603 [Kwoniella dejecticola CBS 10117]|uniref:Uncharacterized protein n=1 Tax=Kwoniella dejecticola CBS 10117 TaxID=1296121 RepID=A0A1A5ZV72_9TREE|nr:uncharacterized protein I303_07614 [Kwoniella dejecticola CBS 10117]OBR81704.1 hypothetical protein I303_07614 [Kwoniella dejecticola CBS 10117]